jgi:hypothetical protein
LRTPVGIWFIEINYLYYTITNYNNMGWKYRKNELSLKEFYNLNKQQQDEYVQQIVELKEEERSSMDEILLNRFNKNNNEPVKFLEL